MLDTLRRIVQEVSSARNLDEALAIIVRRVKESMVVDVCSVYLFDVDSGYYVLMATDGLNPTAVGRVRLRQSEGLVGLVGERQEPVNKKIASAHPRFRYFPETGEERYDAFLGVPLIHYRQVLGVLVAQRAQACLFSKDEVAFLVTVAAQLAGAIKHSVTEGGIGGLFGGRTRTTSFVQGVRGSPGVAIGTIVLPYSLVKLDTVPNREVRDIDTQEAAFRAAVASVREELRSSAERMATVLPGEVRALFDVYMMLLGEGGLIADTVKRIRTGNWGPGALRDTISEHARVFEQMEDSYLRARAEDIREIGRRILLQLQSEAEGPRQYPERCILVGDEIGIAQIAEVPVDRLAGIVCRRGSTLSHTAVMARALGVPAVMGLADLQVGRIEGCEMIIDGYQGRVYIEPSPAVLHEFQRRVREEEELEAGLQQMRDLPSETPDGARLALYVNSGLLSDVNASQDSGAEGVGLYRTEFPFMVRESFPGEDDQSEIYRKVLESYAPKPVTMRTLDVGGDKVLPYFSFEEDNPFLGWRGIRLTLDHPEIFLTQLRAMLRANAGLDNLRLLLPMVSKVDEVDEALGLLERAHRELLEEGEPSAIPHVGVMIEVPAAVYQAADLARRVDFLSVGTNDLTQYLLAVDRNNARVASLYDSLHPAVIRAVLEVVRGAQRWDKPVSVCGEMAGDPAAVILLLGMGIEQLSMAVSSLPRIKWVIRNFARRAARALLEKALGMEDAADIRRLLNGALDEAGLGGLVRAGK